MGGRQVLAARRRLAGALDAELPEHELAAAARSVVTELGSPDRLWELVAELASGEGDPVGCARLSYRHVLGFDKLLLIDGGPRHMLRAHVWHPGTGAIGEEDIHNHRSPLASYVVQGRLAMELYEVRDEADGIAAARYEESLAERSADWVLRPAGPARLRLTHVGQYAAGSSYALPAHTLHRAWCDTDAPTVTLFLETGAERRPHTDVFTAAGPHPGAVAKVPLEVPDYLDALRELAERLRAV
ncbi:hypothetical protein EJ357_36680 [Streptomyces cyaneochromogenes]|uniref:Cysteine dioxygenase n=1 Tax=Streptomyces cyaneochromogenes TaxID=2496836 RepID=A0A3Q9ESK8_9ACTN|nr:hypothetical protein [Streptomyces cyaneochromogenes]AZQ38309.1 hypothetical protein EJ357_36680 [Streptomyces cyaneochromogenes]